MATLTSRDYRNALEVVYAAGEVDGAVAFPAPVLEALGQLIPCDVVAFHAGGEIVYVGKPRGRLTPEIRAAHLRFKHEDPFRPADGPRSVEDFMSLLQYRRTCLYNEVDRALGVEHMLQLYVDPGRSDARLEFDRCDAAFGERDRVAIKLLLPYLQRFLRRASPRGAVATLSPRESEILEYVADGRTNAEIAWTLGISADTVRKHLENAYAKLGVHNRTAAVAAAFGAR